MHDKAFQLVLEYVRLHYAHTRVLDRLVDSVGYRNILREHDEAEALVRNYAASEMGALAGCAATCVQGSMYQPVCQLSEECGVRLGFLQAQVERLEHLKLAQEERKLSEKKAELYFAVRACGEEAWTLAEHLTQRA